MRRFFLDASALVKRYAPEPGSVLVDHLFSRAARTRLMCLMLGAAETAAILIRKRNRGDFTPAFFSQAVVDFEAELLVPRSFRKVPVTNRVIERSLPFLDQYSLNATDAVILLAAVDIESDLRAVGDDLAVIASDLRLLRAAQGEGLATFDPERQVQTDLDTLLGP